MLDETDHILVPGAEVIFHSAVTPNWPRMDTGAPEMDETQACVPEFLYMEVELMTVPASPSPSEKD